ncbi:MAG: TonB-dependent receptor [Pseudomonadota bacterium]
MRLRVNAALGVLLIAALPAMAQSSDSKTLSIPAQDLDAALLALGQAFGMNVVAAEDLTVGLTSSALQGDFTPDAALKQLLSGTELVFEVSSNGTFIIQRASVSQRLSAIPDRKIEEIVIRGEKIDRPLLNTLSSVSVLEGEVIDNSYITDLSQIFQRITNVSGSGSGFAIRGIPERGVGSGTGDTSQTSAVYVDGAVQSQFSSSGGIVSTWDISQVEVFRGAQTTTQGRAALGGAVIVNTEDPGFEWSGRARIAGGEYDTRQYAAALGGPIIDETLAFRIAVDSNETDGFNDSSLPMVRCLMISVARSVTWSEASCCCEPAIRLKRCSR